MKKKIFRIGVIATGGRGGNAWKAHNPEKGVEINSNGLP